MTHPQPQALFVTTPISTHLPAWFVKRVFPIVVLLWPTFLVAAETPFVVREWHREEGLPSEVVTDVVQSRDGYLWLATLAGLVRFDGREFQLHVAPEAMQSNGPSLRTVIDRGNDLWVVGRSGDPMSFRDGTF